MSRMTTGLQPLKGQCGSISRPDALSLPRSLSIFCTQFWSRRTNDPDWSWDVLVCLAWKQAAILSVPCIFTVGGLLQVVRSSQSVQTICSSNWHVVGRHLSLPWKYSIEAFYFWVDSNVPYKHTRAKRGRVVLVLGFQSRSFEAKIVIASHDHSVKVGWYV